MVGIKVSSYSECKLKNGLSCIEQFRNLGQNGTCYYIVFDEWKDACTLCVCGGSESEYTSGWKDFILGPRLEGVDNKFQLSSRAEQKVLKQLRGNKCFFNICFQFGCNK